MIYPMQRYASIHEQHRVPHPRYLLFFFRGRVDDYSFFDCSTPFFLLIVFHCTFSISFKILPYFVYCYKK